ncbi:hypothetical protein Pla52o_49600 [Novipirellula galeiformis]|uniref:Uncharacterized protein n=1 Tax=Novipirellula galeiformis TaxID=2528004 RepID=A0A5C6C0N1_9BACT|nr:hypothetical protein [Novipirellula galeiformis]TWU17745.1 hypothetical protein Pla52o_49600 [Novipirellula galeiformis]
MILMTEQGNSKSSSPRVSMVVETVHGLRQEVFFEPLSLNQPESTETKQLTSGIDQTTECQPSNQACAPQA